MNNKNEILIQLWNANNFNELDRIFYSENGRDFDVKQFIEDVLPQKRNVIYLLEVYLTLYCTDIAELKEFALNHNLTDLHVLNWLNSFKTQ